MAIASQRYLDNTSLTPYLWHPDSMIFVTYEDTVSLDHKMKFLRNEGLAGFMFWEYKGDDGTLVDFLWRELRKR
jgi:chitinase